MFPEKASFYRLENIFYLKEGSLWQYLVDNAGADDISVKIDKAMKSIKENPPYLKGTLPFNLKSSNLEQIEASKKAMASMSKIFGDPGRLAKLAAEIVEYYEYLLLKSMILFRKLLLYAINVRYHVI